MSRLIVATAVERSRLDLLRFFQTAFMWKFNRFHDCIADVREYREGALAPPYVTQYAKEILEKGEK